MSHPLHTSLYRAQVAAHESFSSQLLTPISVAYIQQQKGLHKFSLWISDKAYDVSAFFHSAMRMVSSGLSFASSSLQKTALGQKIEKIADTVYPINPVNGKRHFIAIPRSVEKFLGDYIFYPISTLGLRQTNETLPGSVERMADKVNTVCQRLVLANQDILNPSNTATEFNYRVKTVQSPKINAFATPGGGMVVFSQLIKEIDAAIKTQQIKEVKVTFADGSSATVDLSLVKTDDVIAALLGHEMTHVASRHSIAAIVGRLIRSVVSFVGRIACISYLKSADKEYQRLASIPQALRTRVENQQLQEKEAFFQKINTLLSWIENKISALEGLFQSRKNEYEADVTGAYMAEKAGYNPLGALYLQELLAQDKNFLIDFAHKHLEFMFTHPWGENRKRAIMTAIHSFDKNAILDRITKWDIKDAGYDMSRASTALKQARIIQES